MAGLGVVSLSVRGALVAERLRVFMYGDGFASIDGELIAARTGEQRTGSVPAARRQRQPLGIMYEVQILWKEKFSKSYEPPRGGDGDAREELAAGVISPGNRVPDTEN
jgi:hypothetical protein